MKRILNIWLVKILLVIPACSIIQQTSEISAFAKCEFRIESARNIKLAGISVQDKQSLSDLSIMELAKIGSALTEGVLPLNFDLNIQIMNPNPKLAAMNRIEWTLIIDDIEMTSGVLNQRVEIQADSVTELPVAMSLDLMKSLNGKSGDALINFAMNMAGSGSKPTRIKLKAKPTILIGTTPMDYPGYITIKEEFGAE